MKKTYLAFLLLFSNVLFSQINGSFSIDWQPKKEMYFGECKSIIPYFRGDAFHYDDANKLINFTLKLPESAGFSGNDVAISNIIYENITKEQLGDLDFFAIPKTISSKLFINESRGIKQAFIVLNPIIFENFEYKLVKSFSYNVTNNLSKSNSAKNFRTKSISNSVLASGDWYQFYVEKSGVYKISKRFLQDLGVNLNGLNPKKIKIYGNGGRMLPLSNAIYYPNDLAENAIQVSGENDGVFNDQDYILFYAEGVDTWNDESKTFVNLYDTKSYYYVNIEGNDGKRITALSQPNQNATLNISTFDDTQFHENDKTNIGKLGRKWFGEAFDIDQEQEFSFNFPNVDTSVPIKIAVNCASAAFTPTSFKVFANGQDTGTINFPALPPASAIFFYETALPNNTTIATAENVKIKLQYDNNSIPGSRGFLDKIVLSAKRKLQGYGKQFHFQHNDADSSSGIANYTISNASGISQIWDVTDIYNVTNVENNKQAAFSFKAALGEVRKYIAIDEADFYSPLKSSRPKIANQNLKGTLLKNSQGSFQDIDYAIITPLNLSNQAEKLANFHRTYSKLNVKVITLESIYQEFSSGKQDIAAIRNCIKYIYDNASDPNKRIKYVNLFGDASYDYKNRIPNNTNIVPIYHALFSEDKGERSFASDDFFGFMDVSEGYINENPRVRVYGGIDIAIGRMIHDNAIQAEEMVNKVIEYYNEKSFGSWRNNYVMVSDDSDASSDATLQRRQNILSDRITTEKPFLNVDKIFLDAYVQDASSGGKRYPKARSDLFAAFEKGALVVNYLGHGGEDGLAAERLWEKSDGENLSNQYKYPLFITITCDFSRFDNPSRPTAGEFTYWNPKGGAISMLTTVREIGQPGAENFNDVLGRYLFSYGSNNYTSIAEALRLAKNDNSNNSSSKVVFYIGDPALMLAIPKPKIRITKINDKAVSEPLDEFKSLAKMKITGEVTDENNNSLSDYNGELFTAIFDKNVSRPTLNNDGNAPAMQFAELGETIYRGNASITNGQFEFSFIVPKDIRIPIDNGKISFYAKKSQSFENQTGFDTTIKVGGINENAVADNISPNLKLYMNDETFVSGGNTNESPFLIANITDESGINTASGIGHDMVAILDGDVENPFVLNDYYQTDLNDFTKGKLRFPFRNLKVGVHTLTVKAWDVYNNPVTAEIHFTVVDNQSITLTNVLNYPNPFVNYTEFWFTHNRPFEPLEVQVQVYTITGKVVWTQNQIITTDGFLSKEITWNGKDDFGNKIGKGVYVYKLTVKSNVTNSKAEKFEKLVVL